MIYIITVINTSEGAEKIQSIYDEMRNHPEKSYMIVAPSLYDLEDDQIDIKYPERETRLQGVRDSTKLDNLKYHLARGNNVMCTHRLFLGSDDEVFYEAQEAEYTLFVVDTLNAIKPINNLIKNLTDDSLCLHRPGTANFLTCYDVIKVDRWCRVSWISEAQGSKDDWDYYDILDYEGMYLEQFIKSGKVLCVDNQFFYCIFPLGSLTAFEDVYIAYNETHDFDYTLDGVRSDCGKSFELRKHRDVLTQAMREIYEGTPIEYRKHLRYILPVLEHLSFEFNTLCWNPDNKDPDAIDFMTLGEFCDLVGYNRADATQLWRDLRETRFNVNRQQLPLIKVFCGDELVNGHIFVNPRVLYKGNQPEQVAIFGVM